MNLSKYSHLLHYIKYRGFELKGLPPSDVKNGMLITSIDLDVGNRKLGTINAGKNDINVNYSISEFQIGVLEEIAIPLFMKVFDEFQMPVTIAVRGQLLELSENALAPILDSSVKHDIGAHGYSHRSFPELSCEEAETELRVTTSLMKELGIFPKSFVFPKSRVAHLDLLSKYGYACYRGWGNFLHDGMYIRKHGQIYDIHPSLQIDHLSNEIFMKKILDICIRNRLPLHVWFHPWRFGRNPREVQKSIRNIFLPFIQYARKKVDTQELTFETMRSSIDSLENSNIDIAIRR